MSLEGNRSPAGKFSPGEAMSASKLNKLGEVASFGRQLHSANSSMAQGPFGTVELGGGTAPTAATVYDYPFKVSVTSGDGNEKIVRVRAGTVNNFVPKISGKYLDADPEPTFKFSSVTNGKKIVALKVTKDGAKFFPKTVEVILVDSESEIDNTDSVGYLQLASITCTNTAGVLSVTSVSQFIYASQVVARAKPGTETAIWAFSSR